MSISISQLPVPCVLLSVRPSLLYSCLSRSLFALVANHENKTKHPNSMLNIPCQGLGIVTDYTSIIIVTVVLVLVAGSCIG